MTPYEAVYGCAAPSLIDYVSGTSSIAVVDSLLTDRTVLLKRLRDHLQHAKLECATKPMPREVMLSSLWVTWCTLSYTLIGNRLSLIGKT